MYATGSTLYSPWYNHSVESVPEEGNCEPWTAYIDGRDSSMLCAAKTAIATEIVATLDPVGTITVC